MNALKPPQALCTFALFVFFFLFPATRAFPQWTPSPVLNTPVCTAPVTQLNSVAASDGAGGAIIAWVDNRFGLAGGGDIFAQRIDNNGVALWLPDGVPMCVAVGAQANPAIISDGAGGAFVTWQDFRNGVDFNIFAQRVTALGTIAPGWPADGAIVCPAVGAQIWPMLVADAAGGAIIAWEDERLGPGAWDIYAQRVSGAGVPQWPPFAGAVGVCVAPLGQFMPMIEAAPGGGAYITWYDMRGGVDDDIYMQRITSLGGIAPGWPVDGLMIAGLPLVPGSQTQPVIVSDAAGGAIVTWYDLRSGVDFDIYAQRMGVAGAPLWLPGGVPVCTVVGDQELPKLVGDGAGGAIISWNDGRLIVEDDIYAQYLNAFGIPQWVPGGFPVCAFPGDQQQPKVVSDGAGGAIISWNDERTLASIDIYAQRMSPAGIPQWGPTVAVSIAPGDQSWPFQFIPTVVDGNGGAIISWTDARAGIPASDIYVQRINANGSIGPVAPDVVVNTPVNNDSLIAGSNFDITWVATSDSGIVSITLELTTDGGVSYTTIATGESNDSLYTWTVPATYSDNCRIRVTANDSNGVPGSATSAGLFHIVPLPTSVGPNAAHRLLLDVYPNPLNPSTTIEYSVLAPGWVSLRVYDVSGRPVRTLVDAVQAPGVRRIGWDGITDAGNPAVSGVYLLRLDAGGNRQTRKMVLLK